MRAQCFLVSSLRHSLLLSDYIFLPRCGGRFIIILVQEYGGYSMIQFFVLLLLCGSGVQSAASLCRFVCFPSFSTVLLPDLKLCFDAFMQAHILLGWGKYKEPQYH